MRVRFSRQFSKQYDKVDFNIKSAFDKRLKLFIKSPYHPQLNNHSLKGKYSGYRSINITGDWRALYSQYFDKQNNKIIIFEVLGTHSQLYK
jgi:addiction module RelE/StbE family toxin